jgi:hypothetical protein
MKFMVGQSPQCNLPSTSTQSVHLSMTEIHRAPIQISRPMGTHPGVVEQACYFIEKDVIVLCHRDGTAIMREGLRVQRRRGEPPLLVRWEGKLRSDEDHRRAARELLMQKYNATKRGNDQHRPLVYPTVRY